MIVTHWNFTVKWQMWQTDFMFSPVHQPYTSTALPMTWQPMHTYLFCDDLPDKCVIYYYYWCTNAEYKWWKTESFSINHSLFNGVVTLLDGCSHKHIANAYLKLMVYQFHNSITWIWHVWITEWIKTVHGSVGVNPERVYRCLWLRLAQPRLHLCTWYLETYQLNEKNWGLETWICLVKMKCVLYLSVYSKYNKTLITPGPVSLFIETIWGPLFGKTWPCAKTKQLTWFPKVSSEGENTDFEGHTFKWDRRQLAWCMLTPLQGMMRVISQCRMERSITIRTETR